MFLLEFFRLEISEELEFCNYMELQNYCLLFNM